MTSEKWHFWRQSALKPIDERAALSSTVSTMKCPATDSHPQLTKHYVKVWQTEWDGQFILLGLGIEPRLG